MIPPAGQEIIDLVAQGKWRQALGNPTDIDTAHLRLSRKFKDYPEVINALNRAMAMALAEREPQPEVKVRKPAEKIPKQKPKPTVTAKPVRPTPRAKEPAVPKRKSVAILLAVFLGLWSWLYTYDRDKRKFWVNLIVAVITFGFWGIISWVWAIVDTAIKPSDFYQSYPAVSAVYPKRAYFLIVAGSIISLISIFALIGTSANPPTETPEPTVITDDNIPVILKPESVAAPSPKPTINSIYLSAKAPVIDGLLSPDEWPEPAFEKTFAYSYRGAEKTGDMAGYFMNDDDNLYVLVTASAEDFNQNVLSKEKALLALDIFFDEDNDGVLRKGEDNKKIWEFRYQDCHQEQEKRPYSTMSDEQEEGAGICVYSNKTHSYVYEFQIPLDSGDPEDLAVRPGDTIGIRVVLSEYQEVEAETRWDLIGSDGWPTGQSWIDGTYGQLVLAKNHSSLLFEDDFSNPK